MKKLFLTAVSAIGIFAGCIKNETVPVTGAEKHITYQAVTGKAVTRTILNQATYPIDRPFGTMAFFYPYQVSWPDEGVAENAENYIANSQVRHFGSYWSTADDVENTEKKSYWPETGQLAFYSYSPWNELKDEVSFSATDTDADYNAAPDGLIISEWDVDANQEVDIMVADVAIDKSRNDGTSTGADGQVWNGVPTVFRHKLSQIVGFNIRAAEDYTTGTETFPRDGHLHIYINSIAVTNVRQTGTYTSTLNVSQTNPGVWVPTGMTTRHTLVQKGTGTSGTEVGKDGVDFNVEYSNPATGRIQNYLLILPQYFNPATSTMIEVTYTVRQHFRAGEDEDDYATETRTVSAELYQVHAEKDADGNITNVPQWEMNKIYTYSIVIDLRTNNRLYWAPSVINWEDQPLGEYIVQ